MSTLRQEVEKDYYNADCSPASVPQRETTIRCRYPSVVDSIGAVQSVNGQTGDVSLTLQWDDPNRTLSLVPGGDSVVIPGVEAGEVTPADINPVTAGTVLGRGTPDGDGPGQQIPFTIEPTPSTIASRSASGTMKIADGVAADDVATVGQLNALDQPPFAPSDIEGTSGLSVVGKTSGTTYGEVGFGVSAIGGNIAYRRSTDTGSGNTGSLDVADPIADANAATKLYVDQQVAAVAAVETVVAGDGVAVDSTDPDNPVVSVTPAAFVDPSTGTIEDVINSLIAAGLMESS